MIRLRRAGATVLLTALIIGAVALSPRSASLSAAWQETAALPVEVGSGPVGDRGFAFVGRNRYESEGVALFGYLTALNGLDPALLYADASSTLENARFTYAGEIALSSRSTRGDVSLIAGEGNLRIFVDDSAGESWDDPRSFADGEPVADYALRLQETVQRQAPGVGVVVGDGVLRQRAANEFALDGERYRFGQTGIEQRFRYVGAPLGGGGQGAPATVNLTGATSVTSREAISVRLGSPVAQPAATPLAIACAELEPWLSGAMVALDQAQARGAVADRDQISPLLGVDEARQAAADVAALATSQRESGTPQAATAASRLVVTALSTYARGLQTLAQALADQDADLLAQADAILLDGDRLIERARTALVDLGEACAAGEGVAGRGAPWAAQVTG